MDFFETHFQIVGDRATYIRSFIQISNDRIRAKVEREHEKGKLWSQPPLQFNPSFAMFGRLDDLTDTGRLHPEVRNIFKVYELWRNLSRPPDSEQLEMLPTPQ